jgi:spectinomycin phosphotransferase
MQAASYDVAAIGGRWFAKVRFGSVADAPLEVPRALLEAGISNVLAPVRTLAGTLSHRMDDHRTVVVYPFVAGQNAVAAGMTARQWRTFGASLRAVHDSGLEAHFADRLPAETFALPSAALARKVVSQRDSVDSPAAERLRGFLVKKGGRIGAMLERAEQLGAGLRDRRFELVLVHSDIHAANVLLADDGRILLVDWDGPMLAPRERDLLFVIGSRIARDVQPHEQAWFFEGYGEVRVDREAIVYYRYERIIEDIGEFARSVFDEALPEASRESQLAIVESFFEPGGIVESAEHAAWRGS